MARVYVDIETYSSVNLPKTGVYRYAESPDFLVLMAAWSIDGGPVQVETDPERNIQRLKDHLSSGDVLVAHNAQFERVCFSRLLGMPVGEYLDPEPWHDTQALAGEYGYPQSLENLAKTLRTIPKDTAGTRLINIFSKPHRGKRVLPGDKPDDWMDFISYCAQDVETLVEVDRILGDWPTPQERLIYLADQRINDAGIHIDVDLAEKAVEAARDNRMFQELRFSTLTGVDNPGSNPQVLRWLRENLNPSIKNLQAATIEKLLSLDGLTETHREVLQLRQELALVASKKFDTALMSVSGDDRIRGTLKFFGAHTGRWSGRGTQVQNLPREAFIKENPVTKKIERDIEAENLAILDLKMGGGASSLDLKKLVRSLFWGPFTVVDYAAIEARVVAWLAGEQWALEAFRDGRDIYTETANRMGGLTRAQGKIAVLALGYNGGINSLKVMGGEQAYNQTNGKFRGVAGSVGRAMADGDSGIRDQAEYEQKTVDEFLQEMVDQWRKANPSIVQLWKSMGDSLRSGGAVGQRLAITRSGNTTQLHLPSGRAITYHDMKRGRYRVRDSNTGQIILRDGWHYADPKKPGNRIGTYGGRMVENATQAVARDIMATALVRLQRAGYTVVGHVHDEIIVEGEHDVNIIKKIMCEVPRWAEGLPIDGEGFVTERYAKG